MSLNSRGLVHRIMGGLDLLIDFATLGEYGLEELPADGPGCEATGRARVRPDHPRGPRRPVGRPSRRPVAARSA